MRADFFGDAGFESVFADDGLDGDGGEATFFVVSGFFDFVDE